MNDQAFVRQFEVMDNLPVGILVVDDRYRILFWNRCMEVWTRKKFAQVKDKELADIYPHFAQKQYTSRIDPILIGGPPTIFSSQLHGQLFPCTNPSGKARVFQTTVFNIPDPDKNRFYAMFAIKDVTELSYRIMEYRRVQKKALAEIDQCKAVEDELRKANEKILAQTRAAIEEERLKVLLQMAGATTHELNQPLMILLENIELLEIERGNLEKLLERIGKINKAGRRIADIIRKIHNVRHVAKKSCSGSGDIIDIHRRERILCIDDDPACFKIVKKMLEGSIQADLTHVTNIESAGKLLEESPFDLILLDYVLPDGDAFDVLSLLKKQDIQMPVIVLTGQGDEITASQLFRKGASDYLSKAHLDRKELSESIRFSLEQHHLKQDRKKAMVIMGEMSTRDELTGLFNRRYFTEALDRETSGMHRYDNELALCLIDIDHFKKVNDTYGHPVGDKVLKRIARFITDNLRKYDISCRYGGEEFGILLPNTGEKGALSLCNRIREEVAAHRFEYDSFSFNVTLSAGIALPKKSGGGTGHVLPEHLIQMADAALYKAKNEGRNQVVAN